MRNLVLLFVVACIALACTEKKQEPVAAVEKKPMPAEFADSSYVNTCKQSFNALVSGDVDAFTTALSDNAIYRWNNGDSLSGKKAIVDYWKDRRTNVIDKMEMKNDIWLALKVNESKQVRTGNWVFAWAKITASYKGGASMTQWIHNIYHFNDAGKIDEMTQFVDRAPIMAAMAKKK